MTTERAVTFITDLDFLLWYLTNKKMSLSARLLYIHLLDQSFPMNLSEIGKRTGISGPSIKKGLNLLLENKLIKVSDSSIRRMEVKPTVREKRNYLQYRRSLRPGKLGSPFIFPMVAVSDNKSFIIQKSNLPVESLGDKVLSSFPVISDGWWSPITRDVNFVDLSMTDLNWRSQVSRSAICSWEKKSGKTKPIKNGYYDGNGDGAISGVSLRRKLWSLKCFWEEHLIKSMKFSARMIYRPDMGIVMSIFKNLLTKHSQTTSKIKDKIAQFFHSNQGIESGFSPLVFRSVYWNMGRVQRETKYKKRNVTKQRFLKKWKMFIFPSSDSDSRLSKIIYYLRNGEFFDVACSKKISMGDMEYYLDWCNVEGNEDHIDGHYEMVRRHFNHEV